MDQNKQKVQKYKNLVHSRYAGGLQDKTNYSESSVNLL